MEKKLFGDLPLHTIFMVTEMGNPSAFGRHFKKVSNSGSQCAIALDNGGKWNASKETEVLVVAYPLAILEI